MTVLCVNNTGVSERLRERATYTVLQQARGFVTVRDETGEAVRFVANRFQVVYERVRVDAAYAQRQRA